MLLIPSQTNIDDRVRKLNEGPDLVCIHATGATGGLLMSLWGPPGASRTLLDYRFTYAKEALINALGGDRVPQRFVSEDTAIAMAAAAYERAFEYAVRGSQAEKPVIGVGITAAVSTDRARHGNDAAFICVRTSKGFFCIHLRFEKATDVQALRDITRVQQAYLIDLVALNAILWAAGIEQLPISSGHGMDCDELRHIGNGDIILPKSVGRYTSDIYDKVFWPERDAMHPNGCWTSIDRLTDFKNYVIFPGSFDPLHYGHIDMAQQVERVSGKRVIFQISAKHPSKGQIPELQLIERIRQFQFRWPVIVTTGNGLYVEKAEQFPGAAFLIGADALGAMLDPVYYPNGSVGICDALDRFEELGTHFYVSDRSVKGDVYSLNRLVIPQNRRDLFEAITIRNDISSSEIRAKLGR